MPVKGGSDTGERNKEEKERRDGELHVCDVFVLGISNA